MLEVYSTEWCPDCRVLKSFLEREGVSFKEINIEKITGAADLLVAATGKRGVPYMKIDDRWVKGYPLDAAGFRKMLRESGLL
jgi:glutaredoxin 3